MQSTISAVIKISTLFLLLTSLISCQRSIEPSIRYYEKNEERWYEKKIYCYPEGKYPATKGRRELAMIQQYKGNRLYESIVFYELWPNGEAKFVSKEGFYTYKNGESQLIHYSGVIPDNIIITETDSNLNIITYYIKNGERIPYTLGYPDGVKETLFYGDKPGVYVWKNGERLFLRELDESEINNSFDTTLHRTPIHK